MAETLFGPWRKSSYSADEANCVEIAWRKSSYSAEEANCVELASTSAGGAIRDSKNAGGPMLRVALTDLVSVVKAGRFDHPER